MSEFSYSHSQQPAIYQAYSDRFVPIPLATSTQDIMSGSMAMNGYLAMPMNRIPFTHVNEPMRNWNMESMYPQDIDMGRTSQNVMSQQYMNSDYSRMYSISQIPLSATNSLSNSFNSYNTALHPHMTNMPTSDPIDSLGMRMSQLSSTPDLVPSQMWNSTIPMTPSHFSSSQTVRTMPVKLDALDRNSNTYTDSLFSNESLHIKEGVSNTLLPVMNSLFYGDSHPNDAIPTSVAMQHPTLLPSQLKSFEPEILLFIFYSMPRECLQLLAAQELYNRGYIYHKEGERWLKHEGSFTNGSITCTKQFNVTNWAFEDCNEVLQENEILLQEEILDLLKKTEQ